MTNERLNPNSIVFGDLYQLLDAVMLTGAEMSMGKGNSRLARISITRRHDHWRLLYWYMVILQQHGIEMRIRGYRSAVRTGSITFSSLHQPLMVRAYRRWYRSVGKQLPLDLLINKPTLCILLAGALRRWSRGSQKSNQIIIPTPPCHLMSLGSLTSQVREHVPVVSSCMLSRSGRIRVPADAAMAFVDGAVPQSIWRY